MSSILHVSTECRAPTRVAEVKCLIKLRITDKDSFALAAEAYRRLCWSVFCYNAACLS